VTDFRYAQFCPLARATEVLGERWTLLVVRELLLGPQRFSDLRRRLPGVSSSVLSARIRTLEDRGVAQRRQLPPPAGSSVVELTELGQALRPIVVAMTQWGIRLLEPPREGDHFEPSWIRLGLAAMASPLPSPARSFVLRVPDGEQDVVILARGGPEGTRLQDDALPADVDEQADASVRCDAHVLMGIATGALDPVEARRSGDLDITGDDGALADLAALFSLQAALGGVAP
jgi:DNA-binding HxlR family transcriptional regulator